MHLVAQPYFYSRDISLRFIDTRDVGMAFFPSDAIPIEQDELETYAGKTVLNCHRCLINTVVKNAD
jgi:hypothetical protein